jgi:DDE superfamily endonuclease
MWCVPELTHEYIAKMEDLLRLYAKPHSKAEPVVRLDEKPVQLHGDKRAGHVARDGTRRRDYEYRRRGTANLFVCVEPRAGRHVVKATRARDRFEFAYVLRDLAKRYDGAKTIHLVVDNLSTHSKNALVDAFGAAKADEIWKRFRMHFTPKHGSWPNQAEIAISLVTRECLGKRRLGTLSVLASETMAWARAATKAQRRINWKFRARDARKKSLEARLAP